MIFEDQAFSPLVQDFTEIANQIAITPRLMARLPAVLPSKLAEFRRLSRYEAELAVCSRVDREPEWLPALLAVDDPDAPARTSETAWRNLLRGPAAAPVLRAACRHLSGAECARVTERNGQAWPDPTLRLFDIDTAAAIAVLAWRGGAADHCARSLEEMLGACERAEWNVLDVPLELWGGLTELFTAAGRPFAGYWRRFAVLAEAAIEELQEQAPHSNLPTMLTRFLPDR